MSAAVRPPRQSWKNMNQAILDAVASLEEHGFTEPTIRSVYYVLSTPGAIAGTTIPGTPSGYKHLDAKIVEMRRGGEISWGFFAVKRGTSDEAGVPVPLPGGLQVTVPYVTPGKWVGHWIEGLRSAAGTFRLPRWFGQPNLVEVWVEKDGLLGATSSWLEELEVTVRAPQGYGAWEFVYDSLKKIQAELAAQKKDKVVILYLGDLDPSGKDIPRFMEEEALAHFEDVLGVKVTFREIALSPDQVRKHRLPESPDSVDTLEKIHRDPRLAWYQANYPPDMFVELDAFYALATEEVQKLLRSEVEALFDPVMFSATREGERRQKESIRDAVRAAVTFKDDIGGGDR